MLHRDRVPEAVMRVLEHGAVIPAHPLALDARRRLDSRRQRALSRYYIAAGCGGLAVGVHTTQFAIREAGLYEEVLKLAAQEMEAAHRPLVRIAGVIGRTQQALREAETAVSLGYHAGLLSLAAFRGASEADIVEHCKAVARVIPLVGFYLQPAVGGIVLPASFWTRFCAIDNVVAVKIAPFNRYKTLDVVHGLVAAGAERRVTLYTGNDDHILLDLLTPFSVRRGGEELTVRIRGGLLGHWSVWTKSAVELLERIHATADTGAVADGLLKLDSEITDCNAAFFDVRNDFRGCIAGCHEVLRRQGLLEGVWCLDPNESLSPGQAAEIERVYRDYPHLNDDDFVRAHRDQWLAP
jgi:dihydrodipicolinate synthase/N-acetylneuraminate lyase